MKALTITRHLETIAFEWYSTVYQDADGHSFAIMAQSSAELEILWYKIYDQKLKFDFNKVEHVCLVKFLDSDLPKDAA